MGFRRNSFHSFSDQVFGTCSVLGPAEEGGHKPAFRMLKLWPQGMLSSTCPAAGTRVPDRGGDTGVAGEDTALAPGWAASQGVGEVCWEVNAFGKAFDAVLRSWQCWFFLKAENEKETQKENGGTWK